MLGSQSQTQPKGSLRSSQSDDSNKVKAKARYFLTWRWHFYAGLFVIPFMLMLSLTGLVMLFDDEIEQARYSEVITVAPQAQTLPPSIQLHSVKEKYPDSPSLSRLNQVQKRVDLMFGMKMVSLF